MVRILANESGSFVGPICRLERSANNRENERLTLRYGNCTMRTIFLILACAILLSACASQPNVRVGGQSEGRGTKGIAGLGIPF